MRFVAKKQDVEMKTVFLLWRWKTNRFVIVVRKGGYFRQSTKAVLSHLSDKRINPRSHNQLHAISFPFFLIHISHLRKKAGKNKFFKKNREKYLDFPATGFQPNLSIYMFAQGEIRKSIPIPSHKFDFMFNLLKRN